MEALAELIGFIRKRKWVLLIPVAVIGLAFVPEGRIFLLYALYASIIGFVSWLYWSYFKIFFSFANLTSNERIAHLLVFFVVFLAPLFVWLASGISPASYQKMTELPFWERLQNLEGDEHFSSEFMRPLEEMKSGVHFAFIFMIGVPFIVFFFAILWDGDPEWRTPWMAGIIAAQLVYTPLLGMYLLHLKKFIPAAAGLPPY